jgi:hypothetical protein
MGEVYCARDTRLNREVAIKVSSEEFTERFEREARAIAALSCRCPLREGKILDGERTARNSSTCLLTSSNSRRNRVARPGITAWASPLSLVASEHQPAADDLGCFVGWTAYPFSCLSGDQGNPITDCDRKLALRSGEIIRLTTGSSMRHRVDHEVEAHSVCLAGVFVRIA